MASCPAFFSASRPPYTFASFNAFLLTRAVVYAVAVIRSLALFVPLTGPWPTLGVLHAPRSREFFFRFTRLSYPQRFPLLYVVCVRPLVTRSSLSRCSFASTRLSHPQRFSFLYVVCVRPFVARFYTLSLPLGGWHAVLALASGVLATLSFAALAAFVRLRVLVLRCCVAAVRFS